MGKEYINKAEIQQYLFQDLSCFKTGTNINEIKKKSNASLHRLKTCPCLKDYYGHQCSIPGSVYNVPENSKLNAFCFSMKLLRILSRGFG